MKKIRIISKLLFLITVAAAVPALAASNQSNMPVTATITALRGIPTAAAPKLYPNIQVQDYYGTGTGCPIQYAWSPSSSVADDGGYAIKLNDTGGGSGRYLLNIPPNSPWHSCWYGIKVDSPAATGTGTDNATQLAALYAGAHNYGPNWVHLDSSLGNCIRSSSILNPLEGEITTGDGDGDSNSVTNTGSCVSYTGIPGSGGAYVFTTQSQLTGIGTTPFQAPKFRNFTINYFSTDTNPGGCIQLNSIAGGFTDDATSQQPMIHPEVNHVRCVLRSINNSAKIGFQCSKCVDGTYDTATVFGGNIGFDLEGFENPEIRGGQVADTFGPDIYFERHGTFGQINSVHDVQILSPANFGQTVDSLVYDDARESTIRDNFFEQLGGVTVSCYVHVGGGFNAGVYNNSWTGTTTNSLCVDGTFNNLQSMNNGGAGGVISAAKFLAGNYYYGSGTLRSILTHSGNGVSGDEGWPFNSVNGLDTILPAGTEAIYTANTSGLGPLGYGASEIPVNAIFTLPITGSTHYLEGIINRIPSPTGTFDMKIQAAQTTSTGQLTCQLEDGGSLVGSPLTVSLTAAFAWTTLAFDQVISTSGGWRCYNSGTGTAMNPALIAQIQLVDH